MFESSLVESSTLLHNRSRLPAVASLCVQGLLVAAFIAIPMLHPEVLTLGPTHIANLTPPTPPAPKPPPERPHVVTTTSESPSTPLAPSQAAQMIQSILRQSSPTVDQPALAVSMNTLPTSPSVPIGSSTTGPNVVITTKPTQPLRVSNGVVAGLLYEPIKPIYPPIAKVSHTEGTVVIQAIISKSGHIESAHVLSGSPMLQGAALDAVRAARYHPYLLNNEPTEVETTISIIFHLST